MGSAKYFLKCYLSANFALFILLPLLILIFPWFYLYRALVSTLAKIFRRDFIRIVGMRDSVLANDDFYGVPKSTIIATTIVQGDINIEYFREKTRKNITEAKLPNSNSFKYSELRQYFEPWGGYLFRKMEENFDLSEHLREWKPPKAENNENYVVSREELYDCRREILQEPYKKNKSPWEYILIRNLDGVGEKSVIIFKGHHGLVDGYSILGMFISAMESNYSNKEVQKPVFIQRSFSQKLVLYISSFLLAPMTLIEQLPKRDDKNSIFPKSELVIGLRHPLNNTLPLSAIKTVSKSLNVNFTAVLLAALTGGLRNYFIALGKGVPKTIDVSFPLPWPGRTEKIRNYFTFAAISLPTGVIDSSQRLKIMNRKILNLKKSVMPAVNFGAVPLTGMLPRPILASVLAGSLSSILLSNFPGPGTKTDYYEHEIKEMYFEGGYGQSPLGLGVSMMSYNGVEHVTINPHEKISNRIESEKMLQCIMDEFETLQSIDSPV